jgi:TP901 family phage tail tape measure protein
MVDLTLGVDLQMKGLQRFKGEAREAEASLRRLSSAGRDARGRFASSGASAGSYRDAAGRMRGSDGRFVGGGGSGGGAGADDFGKQTRKFGRELGNAGRSMAMFGAGTGYALASMVQPALDYERAIVDTIAVTGDAASNLGNEQKLRKLSESFVDLGANATDTARAMEFLALAGYGTQQQFDAMPNVLFAAKAGSEDVIKTAGYLSDVATGFGFGADKFQRVSDVMTYINNETSTTLSATAEAMKEIGPYAQQAGLDFENMAAGIGVLANAGFRGRQAGTAMRNMLLSFTKMSDPAKAELKALGLRQKDFIKLINDGDLQGAVLKLDEAVQAKGLGAGEKFRVMNTIFQRFTSAKEMALALNAVRDGKWDELTAGAKGSKGSAEKVARRKLDSDSGRSDIARAKLEAMSVKLGQRILPALLPIGEGLVESLEKLSNWVEKNPDTAKKIAKLAAEFAIFGALVGPGMMAAGLVTRVTGKMITMANSGSSKMNALAGAVEGVSGITGDAAGPKGGITKLTRALGTAGLIGGAAAAGIAIIALADEMFDISERLGIDKPQNRPEILKEGLNEGELARSNELEARIEALKAEKASLNEGVLAGVAAGVMPGYESPRQAELNAQLEAAEKERSGIWSGASRREQMKERKLRKFQPLMDERVEELHSMEKELNTDWDKFREMEGTVGGKRHNGRNVYSKKDRAKTDAWAELQRRKQALTSEHRITEAKTQALGLGKEWEKTREVKFNPIQIKLDKGLEVNKDAGQFTTLGF